MEKFFAVQQLRNLFSSAPHEVDFIEANTLANTLMGLGAPFDEIAQDLRNLFDDRNRHDVWIFALEYERVLRDHLLDLLHELFHGVSFEEFQRMDIREHPQLTSIFRYAIPVYLVRMYTRYINGLEGLPYPPRGWRESDRRVTTATPVSNFFNRLC